MRGILTDLIQHEFSLIRLHLHECTDTDEHGIFTDALKGGTRLAKGRERMVFFVSQGRAQSARWRVCARVLGGLIPQRRKGREIQRRQADLMWHTALSLALICSKSGKCLDP